MNTYFKIWTVLLLIVSIGHSGPKSGIDKSMMDTSVKPQDDFFLYANGTWLKTYEIPGDRSYYGIFTKLRDEAEENLKYIIEEASLEQGKKAGSVSQKIGDMYDSFMDSSKAEELGISPIKPLLEKVANIKSKSELIALIAYLESYGVNNPFGPYIFADEKNSKWPIINLYQGGLSLPDRDYYLQENERFENIKSEFLTHMEKMFELASIKNGSEKAQVILELEAKLAEKHWSRVDNRDPDKTYNKFAIKDLSKLTPDLDWTVYFKALNVKGEDSVRVYQPGYLEGLNTILKDEPLENWKTYYTWHILTASASLLSSDFVKEDFNFFRKVLQGVEVQRPRWKDAVTAVRNAMGEAVGQLYVAKHFKPEAKERMQTLVNNLILALEEQIKELDWMTDGTKEKALMKLSKFTTKIGYPDKWIDYSDLTIDKDDLYGNVMRGIQFNLQYDLDKLGKPVDPEEWGMTPQTVNAGYNPSRNDITFPAAILQPPFFNMEADDAVNYGAIGAAIGHEITHGFDDKGRKSDGDGNLINWWSEKDNTEFTKRADVMVDQFNSYQPIDTFRINGELTLGENIADLGGLTIAFNAYKKSLNGKQAPVIDGFSGEERFFLGFGQIWATKFRDETLKRLLMTDPHSPGQFRVIGTLSNMPEFYQTFDIKEKDGMYRSEKDRVKIW